MKSCLLPYKESKLNMLDHLVKEGYINSDRVLQKDYYFKGKPYIERLLEDINTNYDLTLTELFDVKKTYVKSFTGSSDIFIPRLEPIEESFNQIDAKRQELGIYDSRMSIGDYNKSKEATEDESIKPGVLELFESNPADAVYEALGFDKQINEIADTKKVDEFIKKYKDALPNIKDGKTLISHLQTVSNRNTGTTKQFADLIIKLSKSNKGLEKLLNNPNLYAKPNSAGDEGAFHWSLFSNLSVNKIVLELDHFKTNTYDDVFLHELIHNLTTQFIVKDSDLFNQSFYNKVKELYSVFDNHLEANKKVNEPLLKSTKDDVKNLKRLKEYFEILPSDAIQHELLFGKVGSISTIKDVKLDYKSLENKSKQDVIKELERLLSFKESRIQEIEKGDKDYYYFNSKTFKQENVLSEFLATFMNDANFREQLKNIDYKNNKSIFQSIIDLISEFIGLTKNDSLYNEFVLNLTNFINNNDYSTIAEQTQKTAYQNRINLLEQQKQQAQQKFQEYIDATGKQDIEGFKEFLKKDDESIYYKNLEDEIKVLEEDKIKIAEKRRNFREWINRFTTLNEVKNDNQKLLESRRQVFKDLGFTETYDNTFELKTSSYVTLISKKQALDDNPLIRFDGKLTGVKYTQKSVDGTYILTYKLDDITKTSIREAQIKGEMPFTKSDLKETLKSEDFLNSVSENIFDGLSPEETQIIKEKLESGEYNINCKL
jgi:hypothetical protein